MFDPKLVQAYQNAIMGSKAFSTRLVKLVVVGVHQIAAYLFTRQDLRSHDKEETKKLSEYVMPRPREAWDPNMEGPGPGWIEIEPRPTIFNHVYYLDADIYPEGVADLAGYWAEDLVIGGIVLFDKRADPRVAQGEPGQPYNGDSLPNIWIHPGRDHVTKRICQLRDEQQTALVDYLLAEDDRDNPQPLLPDRDNRTRLDPSVAHTHKLVYKDPWDRKPFSAEELRFEERMAQNEGDYPEIRDMINVVNALYEKEEPAGRDDQE